MPPCARCGHDVPEGSRFCNACGAPLADAPPPAPLEERKVVSVLFCDLVGFTAASDAADPEDVRARIAPYHRRVRREIERYGGTVEKFVGDAVMAVFGAPAAHEDDAERAVRAGFAILDAIAELNAADPGLALQVRIGVNTGEAVVALAARPEEGEGMVVGDVVNTASRLQSTAPVNGIACSGQTHRATERVFVYEELEPVRVKGKPEPLAVFRPLAARARFGTDVTRTHTAPLVGRELERSLLIGTFERTARRRTRQLLTIVGEPGVGKSRLCAELFAYIENLPELVTWRQGRCLPYGEEIAFGALGEIVKAQCGVLESDPPHEAAAKLASSLPDGDPDRAWLEARLAPLVGAPAEPASQEESFTAWRRFCESLAADRPAVLCFEDLHWADDPLLAFLEHLAEWAEGVPLLLLCTARPELHERHPTWAAGLRNAQTVNLAPLSDEETEALVSALLAPAGGEVPARARRALVERVGGNPLYAEEFARLLGERGLPAGEAGLPDSVGALIAARLDTLAPERKSLLQDAAVVGRTFWSGALAAMGGREPREVELALHELARREFVRPARASSMEGEAEYAFWHVLVRDVCYGQIPRAARAARHRAAAAWVEGRAGDRREDVADVLAHHYLTALELTRAAGRTGESEPLETSARRYLALAGERALALDVASAEASLAKALALAPAGHAERASLLERWARAAQQLGRAQEARAALEEAAALYRAQDDIASAGRALLALGVVLASLGDPRRVEPILDAIELLEAQPPGPELVAAYGELAGLNVVFFSAYEEAIAPAERALRLAAELGLPEPARALGFRGTARSQLGDFQGLEDMRRALALAVEEGSGRDAAVFYSNLPDSLWPHEGPRAALALAREGLEFCERRGIAEFELGIAVESLVYLVASGAPDEAVQRAGPLAERAEAAGSVSAVVARAVPLRVAVEQGRAPEDGESVAAAALETGEPQQIAHALPPVARLLLARGLRDEARAVLAELEQTPGVRGDPRYADSLPGLVRCALALGDLALAARLTEGVEPRTPLAAGALRAAAAALAEAHGDPPGAAEAYADAARRWDEFGHVPERAYALLGLGRSLAALGRPEAGEPLREACGLFASLGYAPALREAEALLEDAEAAPV